MTLTEIIFKGRVSKINLNFLKELIHKSSRVRFNSPDVESGDYGSIVDRLKSCEYVDLAFDSFSLNFLPNVFVNLVVEGETIELLFFLSLRDLNVGSHKDSVDNLIAWARDFVVTHHFDSFSCQPDNAETDDYYFRDGKYGPLYSRLN